MTLTLDMLELVRGHAVMETPGMMPELLWRIEKYLVWRLERVGLAVPTPWELDREPARDAIDEYPGHLADLYDIGEAGC